MNLNRSSVPDNSDIILSALFSDGTPLFRSPSEPEPGDSVRIRFRTLKDSAGRVMLFLFSGNSAIVMTKVATEGCFDWYQAEIACGNEEVRYCFLCECGELKIQYGRTGPIIAVSSTAPDAATAFSFMPGFHVPDWSKGALQYQIFPDRFCNGSRDNDVTDNEYYYDGAHSRHEPDWDSFPPENDNRCFYGGDIQGIYQKLDYLQSIGVEVIYLNPVFVSPSNHKYDAQDYDHIDPHLAVIFDDCDDAMEGWETHNGFAARYIRRTTSALNLERSDFCFAALCQELHRRGMRIILDGVFNHCGSFHKWMDREGIYLGKPGYPDGAYQSPDSPYRSYFRFSDEDEPGYEGWWNYLTLPKLNYEDSPILVENILQIAEKWASAPYSIDGWRLDVAADLGHSPEFNHGFWRKFRTRLKAVNPNLLIVAEHYGDPSAWLRGDQWDTVMNYDAFMEPLSYFLTGMEKHSDSRRDDLYLNGDAFFASMLKNMARFQQPSLLCAMNQLSNHDHSRFMTRTNRCVGRAGTSGAVSAGEGTDRAVFRQAVTVLMTWPGAPTVYYGDEAGQVGWTDPDNRRTYPWGHEDEELIALHRDYAAVRKAHPVLKSGSFKPVYSGRGVIAYARFNSDSCALIVCNALDDSVPLRLRAVDAGIAEDSAFERVMLTDRDGHDASVSGGLLMDGGYLSVTLPPKASAVYIKI